MPDDKIQSHTLRHESPSISTPLPDDEVGPREQLYNNLLIQVQRAAACAARMDAEPGGDAYHDALSECCEAEEKAMAAIEQLLAEDAVKRAVRAALRLLDGAAS